MADIFAIAEAGMRNARAALDTVSHNVANVETRGFKREMHVPSAFDPYLQPAQVEPDQAPRDWRAGPLRRSGSPLDFAIEGDAWFQLRSPNGVVLTRNGSFELDRSGRLVSSQGWPVVLDSDAGIGSSTPALNGENELWVDGRRVAQFLLASVESSRLEAIGGGLYKAPGSEMGGEVQSEAAASVRQGFLESSNVNSLSEMVNLVDAMRKAEASQRVMRAYDETLESAITTLGEF